MDDKDITALAVPNNNNEQQDVLEEINQQQQIDPLLQQQQDNQTMFFVGGEGGGPQQREEHPINNPVHSSTVDAAINTFSVVDPSSAPLDFQSQIAQMMREAEQCQAEAQAEAEQRQAEAEQRQAEADKRAEQRQAEAEQRQNALLALVQGLEQSVKRIEQKVTSDVQTMIDRQRDFEARIKIEADAAMLPRKSATRIEDMPDSRVTPPLLSVSSNNATFKTATFKIHQHVTFRNQQRVEQYRIEGSLDSETATT